MISILLALMKMTINIVVEIKYIRLSYICCVVFVCIGKETVLFVAGLQRILKGSFYRRKCDTVLLHLIKL